MSSAQDFTAGTDAVEGKSLMGVHSLAPLCSFPSKARWSCPPPKLIPIHAHTFPICFTPMVPLLFRKYQHLIIAFVIVFYTWGENKILSANPRLQSYKPTTDTLKTEELHLFILLEEMSFSCLGCLGGRRGNRLVCLVLWSEG